MKMKRGNTKNIPTQYGDFEIRLNAPDLKVLVAALNHEYEPIRYLLPTNFSGMIIDAGGYIGTSAVVFANLFPYAKIISIEPSTENFNLLRKNTKSFNNIFLIKGALSSKSGADMQLRNRGTGQWGYTITSQSQNATATDIIEKVPTFTIPDICAKFPDLDVGLIKLDIEGAEKSLFDDEPKLGDVPAVLVELHDKIIPGCTDSFRRFSKDRWIVNIQGDKQLSLSRNLVE